LHRFDTVAEYDGQTNQSINQSKNNHLQK